MLHERSPSATCARLRWLKRRGFQDLRVLIGTTAGATIYEIFYRLV